MTKEEFIKKYRAESLRSRTGSTVVMLSKLKDAKYRAEYGLYLAEGVKLTEEALGYTRGCEEIFVAEKCREIWSEPQLEMIFVSEDALENSRVLSLAEQAVTIGVPVKLASPEVFEKVATEKAPQGIIAVLKRPCFCDWKQSAEGRYLLLDTIQDPGNLGTIFRSAVAFGVDGIVLAGCADPTGPKTVRASMGAVFRCPITVVKDLGEAVKDLRAGGHRVLAAALAEDSLCVGKTELQQNDCVVIGNEGHGVSPAVIDICDGVVRIPMQTVTESLNASVAASILLWEYYRTFGL